MQESKLKSAPMEQEPKSRLKIIVIAHLLIALTFFVAAFLWGNFA